MRPLSPWQFDYENNIGLQFFATFLVHYIGAVLLYFAFAGFSYFFFYRWNAKTFRPDTLPKDLTAQITTEVVIANFSFPLMAVLYTPFSLGIKWGYSQMYTDINEYGWVWIIAVCPIFLFVTDMMIYFIHRGLHLPGVYHYIHKPHHTYRYTTPFSSHAFHPLDGFAQGLPYYLSTYMFPMHNIQFLCLFVFVNLWTISIHDQVDFNGFDFKFLNSTGHHTLHHTRFRYNYGQYFTLWDKICGTYLEGVQTHDFAGKRIQQSSGKGKIISSTTSSSRTPS